jgi:hypothetical protein
MTISAEADSTTTLAALGRRSMDLGDQGSAGRRLEVVTVGVAGVGVAGGMDMTITMAITGIKKRMVPNWGLVLE